MNTTENNKIIREFHPKMKVDNGIGELTEVENLRVECLRYNLDWNWLMEVVEKIESLGYHIIIEENWCKIKSKTTSYKKERIANSKIESVYNACIEFIKWYNEQGNR